MEYVESRVNANHDVIKIGDIVLVHTMDTNWCCETKSLVNKIGIVKVFHDNARNGCEVGVDFFIEELSYALHTLNRRLQKGSGYYLSIDCVTPFKG